MNISMRIVAALDAALVRNQQQQSGTTRASVLEPEQGDEVQVAFEHGDMRSPAVVGQLWDSSDKPPTSAD